MDGQIKVDRQIDVSRPPLARREQRGRLTAFMPVSAVPDDPNGAPPPPGERPVTLPAEARHFRPWDAVARLLFGRDVFLSYSHRDGIPYARRLARDLETGDRRRRLTCYFDQRSAIIDAQLPREV